MRMSRIILLVLCIVAAQIALGQNIAKGFKLLGKGEATKAKVIFKNAIKSKKDEAVAYYGLALCLSDSIAEKSKPNYVNAYKSLLESQKRMKNVDEVTVDMYRQKYGFGAEMVADKMIEMAAKELMRIMDKKSESPFVSYMKVFNAMPQYVNLAKERYDRVRWDKALRINTVDKYELIKKSDIDSMYIVMADSIIESLHWNNAIEHESLKLLDKYESLYPNTDKDSLIAKARHDIMLKQVLADRREDVCRRFIEVYPNSPACDTVWIIAGREALCYGVRTSPASSVASAFLVESNPLHRYNRYRRALKEYAGHPDIPIKLSEWKNELYKEGLNEIKKGKLSSAWAFYYELFPIGEDHSKEVRDYLVEQANSYYALCDYEEISLFDEICPESLDVRPKDWKVRKDVAKYINDYGLPGKDRDYVSTINYCAPYEPAFWAFRALLEASHKESDLSLCSKYITKLPNHIAAIHSMINTLSVHPQKVEWKSLGDSINTPQQEYAMTISANGRYMYFTRRNKYESIWVSTNEDGRWGTPRYCSSINKPTSHFDPEAVYPNGNEMIYFQNGILKYARKTDEGIMEPTGKVLPFSLNPWSSDVQFTYDGNAVLFATSAGDVVGHTHHPWYPYMGRWQANIDICVSLKDSLGNWSKPINLGNVINTPFMDRAPYLASDMKTLYFASNRHGSIGNKLDIFMSKRLKDDSWTEWSTPVNVGMAINSKDEDWLLRMSADGSTMYLCSNGDILQAPVPKNMRPEPVTLLYGKIENKEGEKVIGYVRWEDLSTGEKLGEMEADIETGEYFVTLPHGKHYAYYIYKDNYVAECGNVYVDKKEKSVKRIKRDVVLLKKEDVLSGGAAINMNNVFFAQYSAEINKLSDRELERIVEFLQKNGSPTIEVSGHTDNEGSSVANMKMSQRRADAVKKRLCELGYEEGKITAVGLGDTKPVAENDTKEGREVNRRVELRVVR